MTEIQEKITSLRQQLPDHVRLVCVSKFHSEETILEAYEAGERDFGESRAQELVRKAAALPKDIRWHFIGSLQINKVKMVVPTSYLIHSVDSVRLLEAINNYATKNNLNSRVLLEIHIAEETTKQGFKPDEVLEIFTSGVWKNYPNVQICGLMGMATFSADTVKIQREFKTLHSLFLQIKSIFLNENFSELSMGMTNDFHLAIEEGSTCVRIGSLIFGERC